MRAKFKAHGQRVFDTYELLEMMLYYTVRYKDTNPLAKKLLMRFSSLSGVFAATRDELLTVEGIGERTADFLISLGKTQNEIFEMLDFDDSQPLTYKTAGEMFVKYFDSLKERDAEGKHRVVAALLDSECKLISIVNLYELDFSSARVTGRPFIEAALSARASVVLVAHNHPYGPYCPSAGDIEGTKLVRDELMAAEIYLAEHYVISGNRFCGMSFSGYFPMVLNQTNALDSFVKSASGFDTEDANLATRGRPCGLISSLLSSVFEPCLAQRMGVSVTQSFPRLKDVFGADFYILNEVLKSERATVFLKLFFALLVRARTDGFVFGRTHTKEEIAKYFSNLIGFSSIENVYIMLFDQRRHAVASEFVSEGTVSVSTLMPRRLLEIAKRHGAASAVLAHNHPGGTATPSGDDLGATIAVARLFRSVGIKLEAHYIIAGRKYFAIDGDVCESEIEPSGYLTKDK